MELGIPVIMAVNMVDVLQKNGDKIYTDKLSKELGCEVVEISALKGTGIQKAAEKAVGLRREKSDDAGYTWHSQKMLKIRLRQLKTC